MEEWKNIEGYDNYEVSDKARVRNKTTQYIKSPTPSKQGYHIIQLSAKGKSKTCMLHRLVAQAFIPNPEKKEIVKHLDCDNDNNKVANLYWQSNEEIRAINGHSSSTVRIYKPDDLSEQEREKAKTLFRWMNF